MVENREKLVSSKRYWEWLVDFTESIDNKTWDDETISFKKSLMTAEDQRNASLLGTFQLYIAKLAQEQYLLSMPCNKIESFKYQFKLLNNYYETALLCGNGVISIIKKIDNPSNDVVYVDEKMPIEERKKREFVQYILLNKDIEIDSSVYAVHIAHASTIAAMSEYKSEKFKIWYGNGDKQKIIILDAPEEKMLELENQFYGIRDTGHNNIPKNTLVALSLGVLSKEEAAEYIKDCNLHK